MDNSECTILEHMQHLAPDTERRQTKQKEKTKNISNMNPTGG